MAGDLIECVPNFSEGRDQPAIAAIAAAAGEVDGIVLLGHTADPDHHRAVITFAGEPEAVSRAALAAVGEAVRRIDLRRHAGVHPRLGAADVLPFVPLGEATLESCAGIAARTAERIWDELGVPCYLYEAAARRPERRRLENVRRGGFEFLRGASTVGLEHAPDVGGPELHPTAGACIVGARRFLIAWNVNLSSDDLAAAKRIARAIRESSGGLPCVKALGLPLASRGLAQVSMNLTDFERTPLPVVYEAIVSEARRAGVQILEAELIGFLPRRAYEQVRGAAIPFADMGEHRVIEERIAELLAR